MPYTPPAQRSPAASRPETPATRPQSSRSLQLYPPSQPPNPAPRPGLGRSHSSTSYLHRHRRSPSLSKQTQEAPVTSQPASHVASLDGVGFWPGTQTSLRQSPPPVNDLVIPTGAVISPPDSGQNSSDDEETAKRARAMELGNLSALQKAISAIEQRREGSPSGEEDAQGNLNLGTFGAEKNFNSSALASPPLSHEARKISHSRSHTESAVIDLQRPLVESPDSGRSSDSDLEEELRFKPKMLRKKSGELVRPALRGTRRPSSMPGTPTYSKAVHFDSHLEHVKHFLQVDRPLAVSAGSSPVETYEHDTEFPFGFPPREPPWEWEIRLPNFPAPSAARPALPVGVEKIVLSNDKKRLIGTVAVANLSYHKQVHIRFTLDYWKTTSEIAAEYTNDMRTRQARDGCDRFNFILRLEDQTNLENKTLFFCVRYNVNGQEFWDNNASMNYQVDFSKRAVPQKGKQGMPGNSSRPLGSPRTRPRPVSMPSFDDFASGFDLDFRQFSPPGATAPDDKPLRFRNKEAERIVPDAPGLRSKAPAQAFSNRYDFGASLSAAIQAASTTLGERSSLASRQQEEPKAETQDTESKAVGKTNREGSEDTTLSALKSEKPALQSQSYNELINKYCFFGSAKSSPTATTSGNSKPDGADGQQSKPSESGKEKSSPTSPSLAPGPPVEGRKPSSTDASPRISRSSSPPTGSGYSSRTASNVSFRYPYQQSIQPGLFGESQAPTAIKG